MASSSTGYVKQLLASGVAAMVLVGGFAAAPSFMAGSAGAQPYRSQAPAGGPVSFADLISEISPAVVAIEVRQRPGAQSRSPFDLPDDSPFNFRDPNAGPTALGSGFFVDSGGVIVTNDHVIADAEQIVVRLQDGRELNARLLGSDEATDLAVLQVEGGGYPAVRFATSNALRVGDWVIAVGNPFGLQGTVTAGIVSALGRQNAGNSSYVDFMQISAPINSGNSGGPTFDLNGDVVGVNSAIFSPTGGNVGIGFAIPADTAAAVVQQLRSNGRVTRGYLGVQVQGMDEEIAQGLGLRDTNGALVAGVVDGGPGDQGGLRQGDVVLRIDGHLVEDSRDLTRRIGGYPVGREARLEVWRDGRRENVTVRLGERPSERELALDANLQLPSAPPSDALGLGASVRAATQGEREANQIESRDPGVFVEMVVAGSDLAAEGVEPGDIILRANGVPIRNAEQLGAMTELSRAQGRPVQLLVAKRDGSLRVIFVDPLPQP